MSAAGDFLRDLNLHGYDLAMLAVLAAAVLVGTWKGFAWQVASLASLALSVVVAVRFSPELAPYISAEAPWNRFLAMLVLYLGTSLAVWLVFQWVAQLIDRIKLKEFDRQLGALFGLAKGVIYCLVITFFAVTLSETARQRVLASRSGYLIAVLLDRATPVIPGEVREVLGPYLKRLDERLDPAAPAEPDRFGATLSGVAGSGSEPAAQPDGGPR